MSEETRTRIIEQGAALIHRQGFNNTGIKAILDASGVPKGSFYFYFKNKEEFGIAIIDHYEAFFRDRAGEALQGTGAALDRLRAFFDWFAAFFEGQGFTLGCPIGNLAQEMGDISPRFRARLDRSVKGLNRRVAGLLAEAVEEGALPSDFEVEETAMFIVEAWHGALIQMKAAKSGTPLAVCHRMIFDRLLRVEKARR